MKYRVLFAIILVCAFLLRVYGLNWDQNQHLHPDERFLAMVTSAAKLPLSFGDYLNPAVSTLNPYNLNFNFFVYGTMPMTLVKLVAVWGRADTLDGITLIGRFLSAVADVGSLLMVFLIARFFEKKYGWHYSIKILAAFFYGIAVLPIQQAHYYTVDTFATFFSFISLFAAILYYQRPQLRFALISALCVGLAIGSKIASVYILPILGIFHIWGILKRKDRMGPKLTLATLHMAAYILIAYVALRMADPRMFETGNIFDLTLNRQYLQNIAQLKDLVKRDSLFPPTVQWLSKTPLVFPLQNIVFFGLGWPYAALAATGIVVMLRKKEKEIWLIMLWMLAFFLYQGSQVVMTMRYFYILYPFLALFAAIGTFSATDFFVKRKLLQSIILLLIAASVWPFAFVSIYSRPHSRVTASKWIFEHIPAQSRIVYEHWDDILPVSLPAQGNIPAHFAQQYQHTELPVFYPDTPAKRVEIEQKLSEADYYILSSNRGYGSIMSVPSRYPYMSQVYQELFAGKRGYRLIADITSYPTINLGLWSVSFNDQWSEEAFTVYDHPSVLIYQKVYENSP
ncbi:hypothetical protein A3D08_01645 [Candidatus Roizmanbacteria bacterium RIFCSPHIGHO2_02_FULL_43_11]|uniref:Glycosyltransferase RgtA/B/C/D-like domain-containing protein n=1 Tax=Candidatus Roizmanbacteria bacterium RIFCSPHIGHO2_02_FULL_43_11 TaxID=1802043 RepID=A0A1F7HL60_9BACT|nr:MAG: hypothetical protein A3D08_01645 [Candidatus Roizmanbacteria bacterium RIFCSPHIGHO2_02_FULL_43_11]